MSASHSQELGRPYIQTCIPGAYTYVNNYNSFVRDPAGYILLGAGNGILAYNGSSWTHGTAGVDYQLLINSGQIIAWSENSLCRINYTPPGKIEFRDMETWERGKILKVLASDDRLFILCSTGLFIRDSSGTRKSDLEIFPRDIFSSARGIYTLSGEKEVYLFESMQPQKIDVPGGTGRLAHILPIGEDVLFFGQGGQVINSSSENLFTPEIQSYLEAGGIRQVVSLGGEQIAIATSKDGILVCTVDGELIKKIGVEEGLYSNSIKTLFMDASGTLWAVHEYALSRIEYPSGFSFYDSREGLEGNILDLARYNESLFAGGNRGLYQLIPPDNRGSSWSASFRRIPGIEGECRSLAVADGQLAAGTSKGLFVFKRQFTGSGLQSAELILEGSINAVDYCPEQKLLLVGTEEGFRFFRNGSGESFKNFSLPDISFDDIALSSEGVLWLSSRSGALFRSSKSLDDAWTMSFTNYSATDLSAPEGSYIKLFKLDGQIVFSGPAGLYSYNRTRDSFEPFAGFPFPMPEKSYRVTGMDKNPDNTVWIATESLGTTRTWTATPGENGRYELQPVTYGRLDSRIINEVLSESGNITWFAIDEGIIRFDPGTIAGTLSPPQVHILNVNGAAVDQARLHKFPNSSRDFNLEFVTTDYNCESNPVFQYRLLGRSEEWSEFSPLTIQNFKRLKAGKYEFQVRSTDLYGNLTDPAVFHFKIRTHPLSSWYSFLFYALLLMVALFFFQKWINIRRVREQYHLEEVVQERTETLIQEKEKAESLLANILPKSTADELKSTGKATTSKFKMCSVLFADIQGFTKIAEEMDADKLIDQLDKFYFQFDSVVEKYNIEKIKTIGDAYMAAGGIPIKNRTNPVEVVLAALEMLAYMKKLKETKADIWDLRIGIHTGSVIAGVVGHKKYSYDIWGDTVNTASRMESSGEPGRVNISATTYKLIKDFFQCEFRGKMPVKYKGDIAMFFVNGLNPIYSEADRITPNSRFFIQVQLLRLLDLEEFILERLEKELPEHLFFHNVEHTSHVYAQVELLGRGEKVSDEDLLLLRSAALLHDMGYIDADKDHEARSVEFAREILPLYRYNDDQVERICDLILATRNPANPQNKLEEIICDANLDHLGRVDFLIQSDKLFQEFRMRHKIKSKKDWNQYQISFLKQHEFYTDIARKMREVPKEQQIENIKQFS